MSGVRFDTFFPCPCGGQKRGFWKTPHLHQHGGSYAVACYSWEHGQLARGLLLGMRATGPRMSTLPDCGCSQG